MRLYYNFVTSVRHEYGIFYKYCKYSHLQCPTSSYDEYGFLLILNVNVYGQNKSPAIFLRRAFCGAFTTLQIHLTLLSSSIHLQNSSPINDMEDFPSGD